VDAAVKIAQTSTGKPRIISFRGGYHGSTGFSLSANGFSGLQKGLFLSDYFTMCDFPTTPDQAERTLEQIETLMKRGDVAAMITECIQGDGGNVVPPPDFHKELAALTRRFGAIFVVDEVQSGAGRSGKWWEIETFGVIPDILCAGKAITSGYIPMSACIARADLAQNLAKAQHLFTYSGHPPSAAVGNKVFEIIENERLRENAFARGEQLKQGLQKLVNRYPFAKEVRGRGLHIGFEVYDDGKNLPLGGLFAFRCAEKGLYPGYFGSQNQVMRLHPPLIVTEEEIEFAIETISAVAGEWSRNEFPQSTIQNYRTYSVGLGTD
jgi:4-aminobutyrate aminotransferase